VVAALIVGGSALATATSVGVALAVVAAILLAALWFGRALSGLLAGGSDEALLLGVLGITLLVAGIAQRLDVSGAIGAFLVGLALSGTAAVRSAQLIAPLRDLFAATFFLFFSFQIDPAELVDVILPALGLAAVTIVTKFISGWYAAGRIGSSPAGRARAGAVLIARGEFSIVIAALGIQLADGPALGALAAAYVLITAIVGPLAARFADSIPVPGRKMSSRVGAGSASFSASSS
jgi:CPA2 family monovalent cation:H+ antiporter-2